MPKHQGIKDAYFSKQTKRAADVAVDSHISKSINIRKQRLDKLYRAKKIDKETYISRVKSLANHWLESDEQFRKSAEEVLSMDKYMRRSHKNAIGIKKAVDEIKDFRDKYCTLQDES